MKNNEQDRPHLPVSPVSVDKELRASFLDYAMSVIVSRALPCVRDGLKPVHRRILYVMHNLGLYHNRAYRKSATVIGEVLGKFHPHGNDPVYQAIVGMVQNFAKRYPLLDGQGNWGSIDGDNAAAFRYTEVRMAEIAQEMLEDIDKNTVDFVPNFDESLVEPIYLPAKFPQLLVNGSNGIAVGMATSIPPHNLGEIIEACILLLADPQVADRDIFNIIKAPDFPGGGVICGLSGVLKAYKTGHGVLRLRGIVEVEEVGGREFLIIKEIPYQVNKSALIEKIAELVKNKVVEGISNIRDESSREGIRVVIDVKKGEIAKVVANQLFKHTALESSISIILLAILDNRPTVFSLREMLEQFLLHRKEIVRRRSEFDLKRCKERAHLLLGLVVAIENIDNVVAMIKASDNQEQAVQSLEARFGLTLVQAKAILDMRLNKLTSLETVSIHEELDVLKGHVAFFESILNDPELLKQEIIKELNEIRNKYADKRRTLIDTSEDVITDIDLVPNEEVVVTLTKKGYIKRVGVECYAVQHRGGRGKKGIADLDEHDDIILDVFVGKNHDVLLFFTNKGRVYSTKTFEIPEGSRISRGRAIVNILPLGEGERIIKLLGTTDLAGKFLVMITRKGVIKKTASEAFEKIRSTGIIALELKEGDELAFCALSCGSDSILIAASNGYGIRFMEDEVRSMGRTAAGVRGISLRKNAEVVGLEVITQGMEDTQLLFTTSFGFGKQVSVGDFRIAHRGGLGVRTIPTDKRNGAVIGMVKIGETSDVLLIDKGGKIIRLNPEEIRVMRRGARGVCLIKLDEGRELTAVVAFERPPQEAEDENDTTALQDADGNSSIVEADSVAEEAEEIDWDADKDE